MDVDLIFRNCYHELELAYQKYTYTNLPWSEFRRISYETISSFQGDLSLLVPLVCKNFEKYVLSLMEDSTYFHSFVASYIKKSFSSVGNKLLSYQVCISYFSKFTKMLSSYQYSLTKENCQIILEEFPVIRSFAKKIVDIEVGLLKKQKSHLDSSFDLMLSVYLENYPVDTSYFPELQVDSLHLTESIVLQEDYELTKKEMDTLGYLILDGNVDAINLLALQYKKLAQKIASKFVRYSGEEREEYIQQGMIGMLEAARSYDITLGYQFSTFAYPRVFQSIYRFVQANHAAVIPSAYYSLFLHYEELCKDLEKQLNHSPTLSEMAKAFGVHKDVLISMEYFLKIPYSLNAELSMDEDVETLIDIVPDETDYVADIEKEDMICHVRSFLDSINFTEKQKTYLYAYYGLDGKEARNYSKIAKEFGGSWQNVEQKIRMSMDKIIAAEEVDQLTVYAKENQDEVLSRLWERRDQLDFKSKSGQARDFYEVLGISSLEEFQFVYSNLSEEDKIFLYLALGKDVHHPNHFMGWTKEHSNYFQKDLIPRMKKILKSYDKEEVIVKKI